MDAKQFQEELYQKLFESKSEYLDIRSALSFEEAGLFTENAGLIVKLGDGSEFQITIVESR